MTEKYFFTCNGERWTDEEIRFLVSMLKEKNSIGKTLPYQTIATIALKKGCLEITPNRIASFASQNQTSLLKEGIILGKERLASRTRGRSNSNKFTQ